MFERYTERSRRVIFFARYEADKPEGRYGEGLQSLFPLSELDVADHIRGKHARGKQVEPVLANEHLDQVHRDLLSHQ